MTVNMTEAKYRNRWHYRFYQVAMVCITFAIGSLIVAIGAYITEEPPVWYPGEPFTISEQSLSPGESFTFNMTRCATTTVNYSWTQAYTDTDTGEEYWLPGSFATAQKGCVDIVSTPKTIPDYLPEGNYRLYFHVEVEGTFRKHEMTVRTEPFKVISK